jgi:hypothetical protein
MAPKTIMPTPRSLPSQTTDVPGDVMSTSPSTQNKTDITKYPIFAVFIGTTERIASSPFAQILRSSCFQTRVYQSALFPAMGNKNRVSERQTSGFICLKIGQVSGLLAGRAAVFQNQRPGGLLFIHLYRTDHMRQHARHLLAHILLHPAEHPVDA